MPLFMLLMACAFVVGMSISKGGTCAVTAAKEIVFKRHATMFTGFVIASSAAGLLTFPLVWQFGQTFHLAQGVAISPTLVAGAMLIGIGAVVNDACLLGTLARIGQGEVRFLAVSAGLAVGFVLAAHQSALIAGTPIENPHALPSATGWLILAVFGAVLVVSLLYPARGGRFAHMRKRALMIVMGICGALLFTLDPRWTYADLVHAAVAQSGEFVPINGRDVALPLALLAGSVVSGILSRTFVLQKPSPIQIGRSIAGGAIMAFGGTLIPGGNDSLLLAAIPSGTVSGITAYVVMTGTVLGLLWLFSKRQHSKAGRKAF